MFRVQVFKVLVFREKVLWVQVFGCLGVSFRVWVLRIQRLWVQVFGVEVLGVITNLVCVNVLYVFPDMFIIIYCPPLILFDFH